MIAALVLATLVAPAHDTQPHERHVIVHEHAVLQPIIRRDRRRRVEAARVAAAATARASARSEPIKGAPVAPASAPGSVQALITETFGSEASTALCVAYDESRYDPSAQNASGAAGIFQLMPVWTSGINPLDAAQNIQRAYEVWRQHGWQPWAYECGA